MYPHCIAEFGNSVLIQNVETQVNVSLSCGQWPWKDGIFYTVSTEDDTTAVITGDPHIYLHPSDLVQSANCSNVSVYAVDSFNILGTTLGRTTVLFTPNSTSVFEPVDYDISVVQAHSLINNIFLMFIGVLILFCNFGFGCVICLPKLRAVLSRPLAPFTGFVCQFLIMAPLAFGIGWLCDLDPVMRLGILALGACPGGGGSNMFAFLLEADLELSVTMTTVSTVGALGFTPLWVWFLGRFIIQEHPDVTIPAVNIVITLASVIVPVGLGMLFSWRKPRWGDKVAEKLKPFIWTASLIFISVALIVYRDALFRASWRLFLACNALAAVGQLLGLCIGMLITRDKKKSVTIMLETGFQNISLATFVLGVSLPAPEHQIAGAVPVCYMFVASSIPTIMFIILKVWQCRQRKQNKSTDFYGKGDSSEENCRPMLSYPDIVDITDVKMTQI